MINVQQLTMNIWTCRDKENEQFSNQEMLLTEYHPGHPSTENKFKIHMVNLSSVNHSKSWAKNTAWLFGIFTYIYSSHIVYR